ncbi:MAG: ABC transporter ATP-binding protein, partial [Sporomusaceae bacterium]|nr:ABC transporter ATP-binding protein [Sporomusaceae bacterium]
MMLVKDLEFQYNTQLPILREITFEALPGECLAVLGNNGAGKSTMLKCLNRILTPQKGTVYVERNNIFDMPFQQVARNMAFVAQGTQNSRLTVYDMVMLGRKPYIKWSAGPNDTKIVEDVIRKMKLTDMAVRFVDELSGGEQQKVMLARALAQEPTVLLLDEPTSNLDLRNQYEVLSLVTSVCRENNIAVVIVIHDLNLALRYCDKFMLIKDNQVYDYGTAAIITSQSIEDVYQIPALIHEVN